MNPNRHWHMIEMDNAHLSEAIDLVIAGKTNTSKIWKYFKITHNIKFLECMQLSLFV